MKRDSFASRAAMAQSAGGYAGGWKFLWQEIVRWREEKRYLKRMIRWLDGEPRKTKEPSRPAHLSQKEADKLLLRNLPVRLHAEDILRRSRGLR